MHAGRTIQCTQPRVSRDSFIEAVNWEYSEAKRSPWVMCAMRSPGAHRLQQK